MAGPEATRKRVGSHLVRSAPRLAWGSSTRGWSGSHEASSEHPPESRPDECATGFAPSAPPLMDPEPGLESVECARFELSLFGGGVVHRLVGAAGGDMAHAVTLVREWVPSSSVRASQPPFLQSHLQGSRTARASSRVDLGRDRIPRIRFGWVLGAPRL